MLKVQGIYKIFSDEYFKSDFKDIIVSLPAATLKLFVIVMFFFDIILYGS